MRLNKNWTTHMPMLLKYVPLSEGPVLEIGGGMFSTPLLHWLCKSLGKELVTYENDPEFFGFVKGFRSKSHRVRFIENWDDMPVDREWGVVFIDHHPGPRRAVDALRFKDHAEYIVLHDSESKGCNYDSIWSSFKYRYDWKDTTPWTTVISNKKPL